MTTVYLSIGSNEGDRLTALDTAIRMVSERLGDILHKSPVYESQSWGHDSEDYLNQCVGLHTVKDAQRVLEVLKDIEKGMGRKESMAQTYSSRPIDLDILFYGPSVIEAEGITIPHPRMHERLFVLLPLNDIAADVIHPYFGLDVSTLLDECADQSRISLYR